jgi:uncharacterized RDD family membrane protein YckC
MKPRFEPERDSAISPERQARLGDPEAYDASEEQFAASFDENPRFGRGRFVVDGESAGPDEPNRVENVPEVRVTSPGPTEREQALRSTTNQGAGEPAESSDQSDCQSSWRLEVQAKITHYRRRKRPRPPRFPSLKLQCGPADSRPPASSTGESRTLPASPPADPRASEVTSAPGRTSGRGKLLEFFRPSIAPPEAVEELAEPIIETPRILEVPDVLPPPPALGGILIEPSEDQTPKSRLELPLCAAPMIRRVLALVVDGLFVIAAVGLFSYISWKMGLQGLPTMKILSLVAVLTALLWAGYQYLLLVYVGSTPGLRLAKLRLSRFDNSPVPRRLRRWRVLASILSGLSLTLGYAWCFLDEDQLCWHDRITQTYMAPFNRE